MEVKEKNKDSLNIEIAGNTIILHQNIEFDEDPYESDPLLRLWYPIQDEYWDKRGRGRRMLHIVALVNRGKDRNGEPMVVITLIPNEAVIEEKKLKSSLVDHIMSEAKCMYLESLKDFLQK